MKKIAYSIAGLALLGLGGWGAFHRATAPKPPQYRTAAVERGDLELAVTATGTLNPVTTVQVGSQISGTVKELYADFNSRVRKGQAVAQLDDRLYEAALIQARANLELAQAGLERAKVGVADAARTLARNERLLAQDYISQADADTARTAYEQALAQRRSAEAQVAQAEGALTVAKTNLSYTRIHSPVDGIVISRNVDVGQTVAASLQAPTLFSIARDLTKMQIDTTVDEADIARVRVGQRSTFRVDAYPEGNFAGTVVQIRNAPTVVQNVVTYDVVVRVENAELKLKPGMTANVTIPSERVEAALKVPNAALRYRPAGTGKGPEGGEGAGGFRAARDPGGGGPRNGGGPRGSGRPGGPRGPRGGAGPRVYLVTADGNLKPVPLVLGLSDGQFTEIKEGALREGDLVVVGDAAKAGSRGRSGPPGPPMMGGFR
ncbi:MAG: efflux RND transporter periplasmic adaptor subunit [Deltaproteobacteria bacterium]|nr:efflux RND transporter periplasmic adaptor subunit [Deltaproteobacteria bacterium]